MLNISNLHVLVEENKEILKGIHLQVKAGEVHAVMGPNGSGKSTLANVIAGKSNYQVLKGEIQYQGKDLLSLQPYERAQAGIFLGMQYPVEIPGVSNIYFLKAAFNALRKARGLTEVDAIEFLELIKEKLQFMQMDQELLYRFVNSGFSGGEKKRNEILQMAVLEPTLAVLDETDSGLDIDALKIVADGINRMRSKDRAIILVTHYQRLLDYVKPDYIHVLANGKIIRSGGPELAHELEKKGYQWLIDEVEV